MHRKQRHKHVLDDTAVSVRGVKPADRETETQTKPLDKHFASSERLPPLQEGEEVAATFDFFFLSKTAESKHACQLKRSGLTCLCWGRGAHMSRRLVWSVTVDIVVVVGTVMCLPAPCYYHRVEDCAVLCATSGLLRRANERSSWRRRGRGALWKCRAPVQQSRDSFQSHPRYCASVRYTPTPALKTFAQGGSHLSAAFRSVR